MGHLARDARLLRAGPPRLERWLPWLAGAILVAGVVAFAMTRTAGTAQPAARSVPLSAAARRTARQFVLTAVARRDLRAAWTLAGPTLRQDLTLKQWLTGDIPVVPYPVDTVRLAPLKVDYSHPRSALLEIALLPRRGAKVKSQLFGMQLERLDGRWVVQSWLPRASAPVPCGGGGGC